MSTHNSTAAGAADIYEIRVQGHLEHRRMQHWTDIEVTHLPNGDTILNGPIPDQAALFGLLNQLRNLGIPLIAVNRK
ncbi:MAG: hypothetical protein D6768_04955 [Chloroflexi bacterium]|nr:MAG: hypothetical protein D6768_04955 [Chloroflexota bacterium]